MKEMNPLQEELLHELANVGSVTSETLSKKLGIERTRVPRLVKSIRKRFLEGESIPYIYITELGYSTKDNIENAVYEARLRMKIGFGYLINGRPVFKKCKSFIGKSVDAKMLISEFKPKMITVNGIIK